MMRIGTEKKYNENYWGRLYEGKLHLSQSLNNWDQVLISREQKKQHKLRSRGKNIQDVLQNDVIQCSWNTDAIGHSTMSLGETRILERSQTGKGCVCHAEEYGVPGYKQKATTQRYWQS